MTAILEDALRALPKAERHLHLEGSVTAATLTDLARKHHVRIPPRDMDALSVFDDVASFFQGGLKGSRPGQTGRGDANSQVSEVDARMRESWSRGSFLAASAVAGTAAAGTALSADAASPAAMLRLRWYGGGVYELATPDDASIVLVDAWIWNNTGFTQFGLPKPPELAGAAAYAAYLKARRPTAVIVALTHDHGDHIGDYFELLSTLSSAGIDVKTAGQSDLMRVGLGPRFQAAGLDPKAIVLNNGAGMNMGGTAAYKGVRLELVPAVHSNASGFPPAGFIIDIGDARVYASGDTDLFGDMALIGKRYAPDLAVVSAGNGAYTMGPEDAAAACALVGARHAVPVHYGHNPAVLGPQCGELFTAALRRNAPGSAVTVLRPGESATLELPTSSRPNRSVVS